MTTLSISDKQIIGLVMTAITLWREARGQSYDCKVGVAFSIKNRIEKPSWWGNDWYSVITKKWQYSSLTDPKDKQLTFWPKLDDPTFAECFEIVMKVSSNELPNPVPGADSYFDDSISRPPWATDKTFVKKIGRIEFHNVDGDYEKEVIS